jgi:hypothetical protein
MQFGPCVVFWFGFGFGDTKNLSVSDKEKKKNLKKFIYKKIKNITQPLRRDPFAGGVDLRRELGDLRAELVNLGGGLCCVIGGSGERRAGLRELSLARCERLAQRCLGTAHILLQPLRRLARSLELSFAVSQ